jgi:hypothetical protein
MKIYWSESLQDYLFEFFGGDKNGLYLYASLDEYWDYYYIYILPDLELMAEVSNDITPR